MKIDQAVIEVLKSCEIEGCSLRFPGQLDRRLYEKTAKILKSIGGKWSSSKKAFIFNDDVGDIVTAIVESGEFIAPKKLYQFFPTPDTLAADLVAMAGIRAGEICLEPSAGHGAIARHMPSPLCIELDPANQELLRAEGFQVVGSDFLEYVPDIKPDVIVMNPPFSHSQDAIHIIKAIEISRRCVVAVASSSVVWKNDRHCARLRDLVSQYGGTITELPAGSFKDSGTMVKTVVIHVEKQK